MSFNATMILGQFAAQCAIHGEKATYRVGDIAIANLDVIPGKSQAEAIGSDSIVTTVELQDFQVRSADLVLPGGQQFIPDRRHVIEVTRGNQVVPFVVSHPDLKQAPYRRADAYGAILRVHTAQATPASPAPPAEEDDEEGEGDPTP